MLNRRNNKNFINWFLRPFQARRGLGHQPDLVMLAVVAILLFLGLLFLSSASSATAFYRYNDTYRFVKQQITHGLLPGLLLFYLALRTDYQVFKKFYKFFLIFSLILLSLVFITNLQNTYGSAQSWIVLGGFSFQPSELVKLCYIIYLAGWLEAKQGDIISWSRGTIPFLLVLGVIAIMLMKQPDFGTLSIILAIALSMFFVAGAQIKHLVYIVAAGILGFIVMIKAAPYRMNRIIAWWNPDIDPRGISWQLKQSLIAVGSGGWLGVGLGLSKQKSYVPMPANDSIFAIIAEEIGFVFVVILLLIFAILLWRGLLIVKHAPDNFARFVALGIVVWLVAQILINIAGITQILPLTGLPLPFISLGGSNLTVSLLAVGILANISRFTTK